MEQWEQDALNDFQNQLSRMPSEPQQTPQQPAPGAMAAAPAQPGPGFGPPPDMGQTIKDEVLSGPAGAFANATLRGAADVGDSAIRAGQHLLGMEKSNPLTGAYNEHVKPHFDTATNKNFLPGRMAAGAADFAGEWVAPLATGGAAVKGAVVGAKKVIPSGMTRLRSFLDQTGRFGSGAAMLPNATGVGGFAANTGGRIASSALGTGTAALAADLDNPYGAGVAAAAGGVVGPVMQKSLDAAKVGGDVAMNMFAPSRVPQLRDKVIRDVVGDRTQQVLGNIAQAPNRITPGLPHQVMRDPGSSALHRTLETNQPTHYGAPVADFIEKQHGLLSKAVRREGRGAGAVDLLAKAKNDRTAATKPTYEQLGKSQQPISTKALGDVYSRVMPGGVNQGNKPVANALGTNLDPVITRIRPGQEGLLKKAPAGVLHNIRTTINEKLEADFKAGPDVKLSKSVKAVMRDVNKAIGESLNRSRGGNASTLNKQASTTFQKMSPPVNQRGLFAELYDKSNSGALSQYGDEVLVGKTLANKIRDLKNKPAAWNQLTQHQQKMLDQLRLEAPGNISSGTFGKGGAAEAIAESAIPNAIVPSTRPLPGMIGRGIHAGTRLVAGRQIGKVEQSLADMMKTPGGIQTIEQILRTQPQALTNATGLPVEVLQRLMAASVPGYVN